MTTITTITATATVPTTTTLYPPPLLASPTANPNPSPNPTASTSTTTTTNKRTPLLFPPASIPPPPLSALLAHLPHGTPLPSPPPSSLRLPTTWRCGTCGTLHSVPALMATGGGSTPARSRAGSDASSDGWFGEEDGYEGEEEERRVGEGAGGGGEGEGVIRCVCRRPALQAVYDQLGELYLFWRDDPAVADLGVPRMAEEARWRVRRAGGDGWWVGGEVKAVDGF